VLWCLCLGAGVLCFGGLGLCVAWPFLCAINASAVLPLLGVFCFLCAVVFWWYNGSVLARWNVVTLYCGILVV